MAIDVWSGTRRHGRGEARVHEGLYLLTVRGTPRERGEQHGALLAEAVKAGPIPAFRSHFEKAFGRSALGKTLAPVAFGALQRAVGSRVAQGLPPFATETIRGLAEGARLPFEELLGGATMPDSFVWLVSQIIAREQPGKAFFRRPETVDRYAVDLAHRIGIQLGCTSAIAMGPGTADGKLYHARNFDYQGVGQWPRTQTVVFSEPDDGMKYLWVGAAGICLGGITGMNEAGLTLTVHQHLFTPEATLSSPRGGTSVQRTPIGVVGDVILRKARTLDDAEAILRMHVPFGGWTYLITDGKTGEVLVWEENAHRRAGFRVAKDRGYFGYANLYLDERLGETEANLYPSYWRNNQARHDRSNALLRSGLGGHDVRSLAGILADRGHPDCRVAEALAMVVTTGSVVFRPADGVVWVGTGEAPTSRNRFVPLRLETRSPAEDLPSFSVEDGESPQAREAFGHYRQAYVAYVDDGDAAAARLHLAKARELAPRESVYHALFGLYALADGDPRVAESGLTAAIAVGHPHRQREAAFFLWRGRCRDATKRRDEARADYEACLARTPDPAVLRAAHAGLAKAWKGRVAIEASLGDVVQP
jgi:hypothetical protein